MAIAGAMALASCGQSQPAATGSAAPSAPAGGAAAPAEPVKTYSVAVDASYAPFEYQDDQGNIVGFSVELMKAIARDQGFEFKFDNTPYEGIFARLQTGERDVVLASCTITDERKKTMDFTDPYFEATQMIVTSAAGASIEKFADLKDKLVSVQTGTTGDLVMQRLQGNTSDKIKRMESMPLALNELLEGGVAASVGDNGVVSYFIATHPEVKLRAIVDDSFEKERYGFALGKDRKDDLLAKMNAGLKDIRENGEYDRIYNSWFAADGSTRVDETPVDATAPKGAETAGASGEAKPAEAVGADKAAAATEAAN